MPANARGSVLIVEDHEVIAKYLRRSLHRSGYRVDIAPTLANARSCITSNPYVAVILDLCLPDGDGESLLADIAKRIPPPGVAVVSGHLDSKRALGLWERNIISLPKPMDDETVVQAVERLAMPGVGRPHEHLVALQDFFAAFCRKHRLSPRETLVLRLTALGGKERAEAAEVLGCSSSTISTLWSRILKKTGYSRQRELVVHLLQTELIRPHHHTALHEAVDI